METKFDQRFPLLHHKENVKFTLGTTLHYIRTLTESERASLLSEISNNSLLSYANSKEQLFNELTNNLGKSLVLVGPVPLFHIQYNMGDNHPRIWFVKNNERLFSLSCTDARFSSFMKGKLINLSQSQEPISNQDLDELKGKQTYFVIGVTGDSLDVNNVIKDGKWHGKYWPLVVSVLTVPAYTNEG